MFVAPVKRTSQFFYSQITPTPQVQSNPSQFDSAQAYLDKFIADFKTNNILVPGPKDFETITNIVAYMNTGNKKDAAVKVMRGTSFYMYSWNSKLRKFVGIPSHDQAGRFADALITLKQFEPTNETTAGGYTHRYFYQNALKTVRELLPKIQIANFRPLKKPQ